MQNIMHLLSLMSLHSLHSTYICSWNSTSYYGQICWKDSWSHWNKTLVVMNLSSWRIAVKTFVQCSALIRRVGSKEPICWWCPKLHFFQKQLTSPLIHVALQGNPNMPFISPQNTKPAHSPRFTSRTKSSNIKGIKFDKWQRTRGHSGKNQG